jgi:hypothetical protein
LISAIKRGRAFVGFDRLGDSAGFSFTAASNDAEYQTEYTMGDEMARGQDLTLKIRTPLPARIELFRSGKIIKSVNNIAELSVNPESGPAVYRVEVYLEQLGPPFDKMPWIISNPIYVR